MKGKISVTHMMGFLLASLGGVICAASSWGADGSHVTVPQYSESPPFDLKMPFATRDPWQAVVTAAAARDYEISGAGNLGPSRSKICFIRAAGQQGECEYFRTLFHSSLTIQESSGLSLIPLTSKRGGVTGLVLKATALYDTGQLHETAIWVYDAKADRFRLISSATAAEEQIFASGALDGYLVTADWHFQPGETRFGSDHQRIITVYRYEPSDAGGSYRKVLRYTTVKKYGPEDVGTIAEEMDSIEQHIRQSAGARTQN
jgi:hypothetical protein